MIAIAHDEKILYRPHTGISTWRGVAWTKLALLFVCATPLSVRIRCRRKRRSKCLIQSVLLNKAHVATVTGEKRDERLEGIAFVFAREQLLRAGELLIEAATNPVDVGSAMRPVRLAAAEKK